jgi:hypothetical protein
MLWPVHRIHGQRGQHRHEWWRLPVAWEPFADMAPRGSNLRGRPSLELPAGGWRRSIPPRAEGPVAFELDTEFSPFLIVSRSSVLVILKAAKTARSLLYSRQTEAAKPRGRARKPTQARMPVPRTTTDGSSRPHPVTYRYSQEDYVSIYRTLRAFVRRAPADSAVS